MSNILIFKTASDVILTQIFEEVKNKESKKYCLIQSSIIKKFQKEYNEIEFIDIQQEVFYNIPNNVLEVIQNILFSEIYIPTTGLSAMYYGNIVKIVNNLNYEVLVFYNCKGEKLYLKKKSELKQKLIRLYIYMVYLIYGRRK